jgi:hypothetical protein
MYIKLYKYLILLFLYENCATAENYSCCSILAPDMGTYVEIQAIFATQLGCSSMTVCCKSELGNKFYYNLSCWYMGPPEVCSPNMITC